MSGMVTLDVRVLARGEREVLVCADGVEAMLQIAAIDLAPGTHPWATLRIDAETARALRLVAPPTITVGLDVQRDGLAALITHHHTDIAAPMQPNGVDGCSSS